MTVPRILIVDDEEAVRESYYKILETDKSSDALDQMASSLFDEEEEDLLGEEMLGEGSEDPMVEEELDTEGYQLSDVPQGLEAVKAVEHALAENQPFCLIFLDMRMPPGMDGMETAKRIRALDPHVEIVIMTAYSDYSYQEIVEEVGNPERLLYFHKPFDPEQIQQLALSLTQRWQLDAQHRQ